MELINKYQEIQLIYLLNSNKYFNEIREILLKHNWLYCNKMFNGIYVVANYNNTEYTCNKKNNKYNIILKKFK